MFSIHEIMKKLNQSTAFFFKIQAYMNVFSLYDEFNFAHEKTDILFKISVLSCVFLYRFIIVLRPSFDTKG